MTNLLRKTELGKKYNQDVLVPSWGQLTGSEPYKDILYVAILSAFTCETIWALLVLMEDKHMLRKRFLHISKFITVV